jgi:hypothetical protein
MSILFDGHWRLQLPGIRARGGIVGFTLYLLCITCAVAQSSGGTFTLTRQSIAGGGNRVQGAPYDAIVTIGQAAAGAQSGGTFQLIGGFHVPAAVTPAPDAVFKDDFEL